MTVAAARSTSSSRGLRGVCGVYVLTHRASGRRYVGQSRNIGQRLAIHRSNAKIGLTDSALKRAFATYGIEAFDLRVVDTCEPEMLDELEQFAIEFFDSTNSERGWNARTGGRTGDSWVGEALERKAEINRALPKSAIWRKRQAAGIRANSTSPVWRANVKAGQRAIAPKFVWSHPVHGTKQGCASELVDMHKELNSSHLSAVARGKLRQHKGWTCLGPVA